MTFAESAWNCARYFLRPGQRQLLATISGLVGEIVGNLKEIDWVN